MTKPTQDAPKPTTPKPKSPFDWRGPTLLDWSPVAMTGNKFAAKNPHKNPRPHATPWKGKPATQGGRDSK